MAKDKINHWWVREATAKFQYELICSGWKKRKDRDILFPPSSNFFFVFSQAVPNSLSHHCYFTSRAMGAAELRPGKLRLSQLRGIHTTSHSSEKSGSGGYTAYEGVRGMNGHQKQLVFSFVLRRELGLVTMVVIWNFCKLFRFHGCKPSSYGFTI